MKAKIFFGLLAISLSALGQTEEKGISRFFNPEKAPSAFKNFFSNQISKSRIGYGSDLFDISNIEGLAFNFKIRTDIQPSTLPNVYQRSDRYTLLAGIRPFDFIDNSPVSFGFSINRDTEITFVRSFSCDPINEPRAFHGMMPECQKEALMSLPPYKLSQIPYTTFNALNLKYGDFVSFKTDLNLIISKSAVTPISAHIGLTGYSYFLVRGEFLIHAFKLKDNKIRVKFIAHRGRTGGAGANIGLAFHNFKMFGVKILNRAAYSLAEKILDLTPFDASVSGQIADVFVLDYIFDLSKPEVAKIYDQVMGANLLRLDLHKVANPWSQFDEVSKVAFKDLTPVEELFQQDKTLPVVQRRIDRVFKGSNYSKSDSVRFKIGFNFLKRENGTNSAITKVTSEDEDGKMNRFLFATFNPYYKTKFFFGLDGTEQFINANLLFSTDQSFEPKEFTNLILTRDIYFRAVSQKEFNSIRAYVRELLPPTMLKHVAWKEWTIKSKGILDRGASNGQLRSQVWFKPSVINAIKIESATKAAEDFRKYIKSTGRLPTIEPKYSSGVEDSRSLDHWFLDIETIGAKLFQSFDPHYSPQVRYESFLALKDIPLFVEFGAGFLLRSIPENELDKHVAYNFVFGANGQPTINGTFGRVDDLALQKTLESIQNEIQDRSFDLRLYLDDEGRKTKTPTLMML